MRNKLLNVCLAALMTLCGTTAWALDKVDGVYQIGTADDLVEFAELVNSGENSSCAVLTADIDCGLNQFYIGCDEYNFNGTFDGQGHKVTVNFFPQGEGENLFRNIGGGGEVRNLIVDGTITTNHKYAAGIAGWSAGVIRNCVSTITVLSNFSGDATHGGILGVSNGSAVINCLSAYKVKSIEGGHNTVTENCGGIVGWLSSRTTLYNCLSVADIDLQNLGNCGSIARNPGNVVNDTWNKGRYTQNFYLTKTGNGDKGEQVTVEQLASGEICYKLNVGLANAQWSQKEGEPYPVPFPTYGKTVGASQVADCRGRFADPDAEVTYTFGGGQASETHELDGGRCVKCGYLDFDAVKRDPVDGYYLLSTVDDCKWYNWRRYYCNDFVNARLVNDIDISELPYLTNNDNWCSGDFDGAGHTLTIAITDEALEDYMGEDELKEQGLDFSAQPFKQGNNCLFHNLSGDGKVHDLIVKGTLFCQAGFDGKQDKYAATITNHMRDEKKFPRIYNIISYVDINATGEGDGTQAGIIGVLENNNIVRNIVFAGSLTTTRTHCAGLIGWSSGVCQLSNALMIGSLDLGGGDSWVISRNANNVQGKNIYYLDSYGYGAKESWKQIESEDMLTSGELTYLLNDDQSEISWTQNLGEDEIPMPFTTHKQVYANGTISCDGTPKSVDYSNTFSLPTLEEHNYEDGICSNVNVNGVRCNHADYDYLKPNADGVYEISTAAQLINISQVINHKPGMLGTKVVLTADIDAADYNSDFGIAYANDFGITEVTNGFEPFGIEGAEYTGSLDGQFHTISNLHIYREGRAVGLLGAVAGTADGGPVRIDNVVMDNTCSIYGGAYVGLIGMSAYVSGSNKDINKVIMNNVGIECDILAEGANAGGIIGCCMGSQASFDITNAYTTGHIKGGNESSALTGWFGDNATVTSCWTISEVEGFDNQDKEKPEEKYSKYFGRFGSEPKLTLCFDPYGMQGGVSKLEMEDVESGKLAFELNGKSFADPVWYQNLNENDEHPSVLASRGSVFLTNTYQSATDAEVKTAALVLKEFESEKVEDAPAHKATHDYYMAQLAALEECETMNALGAAYDALDKDSINNSINIYKEYLEVVAETKAKLEGELSTLEGEAVDLLKDYLDEAEDIVEAGELDQEAMTAEIAKVKDMLEVAIRTCYAVGSDVTDLLVNANFAKGYDGWTQEHLSGKASYTNPEGKTTYCVEAWATPFDVHQTVENLKPGVYMFTMNGVFRPSDNIYSYNHAATIYANGIHNFIMTPAEDMVLAEDAENLINCYIEGDDKASDKNLDFAFFDEPQENVNGKDDFAVGYTTRGQTGMCIAAAANRNLNYVIGVVGEDGKLTVGAMNPGTKFGSDGTLLANARLYYLGTEEEADVTVALQGMKDRAEAAVTLYNVELTDLLAEPAVPYYSEEVKAALAAAAELPATVESAKALSKAMLDVYESRQAYIFAYKQYQLLEDLSFVDVVDIPEGVTPLFSEDDLDDFTAQSEVIFDNYYAGSYSTEEALNANAPLIAAGLIPEKVEDAYQISNAKQMVWLSIASKASGSFSVDLLNDLDMAGVNFTPICPEGNSTFYGIFDGQGHKIKNLYMNHTGLQGCGLIGIVGTATVKNLEVDNSCYISGGAFTGLIGTMDSDNLLKVDHVSTEAMVVSSAQNGGGLIGCCRGSSKAQVTNCFVGGIVHSVREGGAVSGWLATSKDSYIRNTLSVAEVYNEDGNKDNFVRHGDGPTNSGNYIYVYSQDELPADRQESFDYLATNNKSATKITKENAEQLTDGSLTWKLNGSQSETPVWFQNLESDKYPRLFGEQDVVYLVGGQYTNEKPYIALNPFAYDLTRSSNEQEVTVGFTLNAEAIEGAVRFYNGTQLVYTEQLEEADLQAGRHNITVDNSKLAAAGTKLTFDVQIKGHGVVAPFYIDGGIRMWSPRGMAINNNTDSKAFGTIYIAEAETPTYNEKEKDLYISGPAMGNDLGVYAFTPDFQPVAAANGKYGFTGGQTFNCVMEGTSQKNAYEPKNIRMSADGRLFVGRSNCTTSSSIYELNPEDLNEDWTPVFVGGEVDETTGVTYVGDDVQHGMNVSFDVEGAGENLKLYTLDCDKTAYNFKHEGFWGSRYDLGTAKTWATAPSAEIPALFHQWTIAPSSVQIVADGRGGLWYIQFRSSPKEEEPSLKHIGADGLVDYSNTSQSMGCAGLTISPDGNYMAYTSNNGNPVNITIAQLSYERNAVGNITPKALLTFAAKGMDGVDAMAFDYAGNLYMASARGEDVIRYALPSTTGNVVVTPAPASETITVGTTAVDSIEAEGNGNNGVIYNIAGQRLNKTQKGVNIVAGKKVMVK